jgi:hypothetical protein
MLERIKHLGSQSKKNTIFFIISLALAVAAAIYMTVLHHMWYTVPAGLAAIMIPYFFTEIMVDRAAATGKALVYARYAFLILIACLQFLAERDFQHMVTFATAAYIFYCLYLGSFFWFYSDERIVMISD